MNDNWFRELFINEAKTALSGNTSISDEQISAAVKSYLEENPIEPATTAVLYTAQTLTNEQKAQVRENIAAASLDDVLILNYAETGEIVTITPAANSTAKVVSKIVNQDADWTYSNRLLLRHTLGKNLYDFTSLFGGAGTIIEKEGLKAIINDDGTVTITGTNTSDGYNNILFAEYSDFIKRERAWIFPAGTYTVPQNVYLTLRSANSSRAVLATNKNGTFTINEPFWICQFYITYTSGAAVDETIPLIMVEGSSLPSSGYEYVGNVYEATFTNKLTYGEFNWQTGELTDIDGNVIETITAFEDFSVFDGENTFVTGVGKSTITYKK